MLINLSNHPSTAWQEAQRAAAQEQFGGDIHDISFPPINPKASLEDVKSIARRYLDEITGKYGPDITIHVSGEMTFVFQFVDICRENGIYCVSATSERLVSENPDGTRTVDFKFQIFRPYF